MHPFSEVMGHIYFMLDIFYCHFCSIEQISLWFAQYSPIASATVIYFCLNKTIMCTHDFQLHKFWHFCCIYMTSLCVCVCVLICTSFFIILVLLISEFDGTEDVDDDGNVVKNGESSHSGHSAGSGNRRGRKEFFNKVCIFIWF